MYDVARAWRVKDILRRKIKRDKRTFRSLRFQRHGSKEEPSSFLRASCGQRSKKEESDRLEMTGAQRGRVSGKVRGYRRQRWKPLDLDLGLDHVVPTLLTFFSRPFFLLLGRKINRERKVRGDIVTSLVYLFSPKQKQFFVRVRRTPIDEPPGQQAKNKKIRTNSWPSRRDDVTRIKRIFVVIIMYAKYIFRLYFFFCHARYIHLRVQRTVTFARSPQCTARKHDANKQINTFLMPMKITY